MKVVMDKEQIKDIIPHRDPFLLLDEIVDIEESERIVALKKVRNDEYYFQGHFPGFPVMPGVLIVEAMAQAAAVLAMKTLSEDIRNNYICYFMKIDEASFRKPVLPGDEMIMTVSLIKQRSTVWSMRGEAKVEGEIVAESIFKAILKEKE